MSRTPPGPRLPTPVQTLLFAMVRHRWLPRLTRRHGPVIHLRIRPEGDVVVLSDLDQIRDVFLSPPTVFHAGEANEVMETPMGEHSVMNADEDAHLRLRRQLTPAFRNSALRGYQRMVARIAVEEVERWPTGMPFSAMERMNAVTLEIILRVMFGVEDEHRLEELRTRLRMVLEIDPAGTGPWLRRLLQRRQAATNRPRVDELLYAEIADRRRADDLASRPDMLSRLLAAPQARELPSDAELHDHLLTLLLAGHETISTALAWSFHELARHPAALDAAARSAAAGADDYLEAVLKEVLRLRPAIVDVTRKLTEAAEVGGYRVPAGWTVMPSILLAHHDPASHPEPATFQPERFLDGGPPAASWVPFGGGVRRCLGSGFALQQGTIVLREVLSRFRVEAADAAPERPRLQHLTLVPGKGARIIVHRLPVAASHAAAP
ncbi:cytochrome P450 [Amycolatopsis samaneae]|uniref:Cytochrome P450 n=1 Tax=Amycolatopsis samaneae TaxID=664691 RepID=A0ABW5GPM2_9PSEU